MVALTHPTFFALLLVPAAVLAMPTPEGSSEVFPEFVPPPGFPSLAELNVTTEMLRTTKPNALRDRATLLDATCMNSQFVNANVDDVITCFNFLEALGTYVITVSQSDHAIGLDGVRQVAQYGTAYVEVQTMTGNPTSSYSSDVGLAVQWIFTNCNNGGWVAGTAPANGNGNMRVIASGISH